MELMFVDFLNSDWRDWRGSGKRENRLENWEWWEDFLHKWELHISLPLSEDLLAFFVEFRNRMREMVEVLAKGNSLEDDDINYLNDILRNNPSNKVLNETEHGFLLKEESLAEGRNRVSGSIAQSFAQLLAGNDVQRIKICQNEDCQWVFHDESRNRARRWCDDRMCGNLMKVRRFRSKQKKND